MCSVHVRRTDGSPPARLDDGQAYSMSPDGKWVADHVVDNTGLRRFVLFPTGPGKTFNVDVPGPEPASVFGRAA